VTKRTKWGTSGQATPRQPPDIVASIPDEVEIIYVGKHGDDADDGLNIESAKLTITAAIAAAVAATPATDNRYVVLIHDAGTYTEDFTVPSWVQLHAPAATIVGTVTLADDADAFVHEVVPAEDDNGVLKAAGGTGTSRFEADRVVATGIGIAAANLATDGVLIYEVKQTFVEDGVGLGSIAADQGHMHLQCEDVYVTGTGIAVARIGTGTMVGYIAHVLEQGAGVGNGTGIAVLGGTVDLVMCNLICDAAYTVAAGAQLNLTVDHIEGTETEVGTGVAYVAVPERIVGIRLLTPASIGSGGGTYDTVQTTATMLAANNTSRLVSFELTHNEALANLEVGSGSVALMVARLNDGSQRIQSLATGLPDDGAAPSLTGTLVTGVGWEATLNANGTVTIAVLEDAAEDRSVNSRYFFTPLTLQVAP